MAVDQDLLDVVASSVADLYREVESSLVKTIADELKRDLPHPTAEVKLDAIRRLQRSAQATLASLQAVRAGVVRDAISRVYRDGHASALTDLPENWFPKSGIGQAAREATSQVPNAAVIENLAVALHRDLGRVDGNILRAPMDAYRAVQAGTAARIATGTATRRQASQAAWQRLIDKGITSFTDKAGREWKLSSYVEMMGRTNVARAALQGQSDRLASLGIDLVVVSDNTQECKVCRPFEGKILRRDSGPIGKIKVEHSTRDGEMLTIDVLDTMAGAQAKGFQHPNCRHSVSAYLPGVSRPKTNTEDPEGNKARQQQRALERKIRAAKERELGALTPEAKKQAGADVRAAQKQIRDHLKAHPKLKRLTYREQIGGGNTPGAGGPKGGPVGDLQPPIQPTLDGGPGSKRTPPTVAETATVGPAGKTAGQLSLDDAPAIKPKAAAPKAPTWSPPKAMTHDQAAAMQNGMRPFTEAQREALSEYTYGWSSSINDLLRSKGKAKVSDEAKKFAKDVSAAMQPLPRPAIVYRYVAPDAFGANRTRADKLAPLVGKTLQDRGFMSTSIAKDGHTDPGNQMARAARRPVLMEMDVPAGTPAAYIEDVSAFPGQLEILLGAGTKYQVVEVVEQGAHTVVRVRVVP